MSKDIKIFDKESDKDSHKNYDNDSHKKYDNDSDKDSESVESCYTCGIFLDDDNSTTYVTAFGNGNEMRQFCSKDCFKKNNKLVKKELDPENPFSVSVQGKCNGEIINGMAHFNMHGTVTLDFANPELKATMVVPKAFLEIVSVLYDPNPVFK